MDAPVVLRTERLLLRRWRASDRDAYAAMNADPVVMEHFAKLLSRAESDDHVDRIDARFRDEGYGLWAVEVPDVAEFIGFVGLWAPGFDAHFTPAVEVGWRLMPEHWGNGYAVEAAVASMDDGFARLELDEIVSMTTPANLRSQRVMQKLGMTRDPADDFERTDLPEGSLGVNGDPIRPHVLYRMPATRWQARHA